VGAQGPENTTSQTVHRGEKFDGTARFLTDRAEHEGAMAAIRGKYWM
jgi:hypothetical protein